MFDLSKLPKDFSLTVKVDGNTALKLGAIFFFAVFLGVAVAGWVNKKL